VIQNFADAYQGRGDAKKLRGDIVGADADYYQAAEITTPKANQNHPSPAKLAPLNKALSDGNSAFLHANSELAQMKFKIGSMKLTQADYDGAITEFSKAIELNPNYAEAYNGRGLAKKHKGDATGGRGRSC
jgi:tetratricopeptide (TPR) repeat protein